MVVPGVDVANLTNKIVQINSRSDYRTYNVQRNIMIKETTKGVQGKLFI